jgi:DinB superfamily
MEPAIISTHLRHVMSTFTSTSDSRHAMNATTLNALATFPQLLEAHYAAIPTDFKNWAPASWEGVPSEPFTPIEQICHVRDIELDGYHVRFQRTLHESNPTLASIDSEILAKERSYATSSASEVFTAFRAARTKTIELISGLSTEQLARTAVFEGYGALSLRSLVHYLCSHDQQHLAGLQWLLGKIDASRDSAESDD